jgi:hypothetical protein
MVPVQGAHEMPALTRRLLPLAVGLAGLLRALPTLPADEEVRRIEGLEFTRIAVVGEVKAQISQGDVHVLQVFGDRRDLDEEPFYVSNGGLLVLGKRRGSSRSIDDVRFRVTLPVLDKLSVNGSGAAYVKAFDLNGRDDDGTEFVVDGSGDLRIFGLSGGSAELRVKGSGDLRAVRIDVEEIEATVSGSGDMYIKVVHADAGEFIVTGSGDLVVTEGGRVDRLEANVVGSGDIDLDDVSCRVAEVNVIGSGTASIGIVDEKLNASVLGSGDIRYRGDPDTDTVELGSGEIRVQD